MYTECKREPSSAAKLQSKDIYRETMGSVRRFGVLRYAAVRSTRDRARHARIGPARRQCSDRETAQESASSHLWLGFIVAYCVFAVKSFGRIVNTFNPKIETNNAA